jgi:hypothetical protein
MALHGASSCSGRRRRCGSGGLAAVAVGQVLPELARRAMASQGRDLLSFCEKLAGELFSLGVDRIAKGELDALALQYSVKLDPRNVRERSLLHHDAEGNWEFVHRSIVDFLLVWALSKGQVQSSWIGRPWTDEMRNFAREMLLSGECKQLPHADLQGVDMVGAALHDIDLSGADLRKTNFSKTNCSRANFKGADLTDAQLDGTDLSSENLRSVRGFTFQHALAAQTDELTIWPVTTLQGHFHSVNGVAMSPDGGRAISASDDNTLKVWNLQSGRANCDPSKALAFCERGRDKLRRPMPSPLLMTKR